MELTPRQQQILSLVQAQAPISGEQIAERLGTTRPIIRADLALLVMLHYLEAKPKVGYTPGSAVRQEAVQFELFRQLKVKDVQSAPVALKETASVSDAIVALFLENVGSLIVVGDDGALAGIVSRKDLLKVTLGNPGAAAIPIGLVMTRQPNVVTVGPDDTVTEAARKLIAHEVDSLPVVGETDGDGERKLEVVGRISKTTMTRLLLELVTGR